MMLCFDHIINIYLLVVLVLPEPLPRDGRG